MTAAENRPTVEELYARASGSHHLEVRETRGDVDFLIAAGWAQESLGTKLYRLRSDFDVLRGLPQPQGRLLRSWRNALIPLQAFAVLHALRHDFNPGSHRIMDIAEAALKAWMDPNCPACSGRRFIGGAGVPIVVCAHCGGSGRREHARGFRLGANWAEHEFGRSLMTTMDRKADRVGMQMRRCLSSRDHANGTPSAFKASRICASV